MNREDVLEELRAVKDPHTGLDIVQMGLVEDVEVGEGEIRVTIRPTNPFCPSALFIVEDVKRVLKDRFPDHEIDVQLVGHVLSDEEG
ncbi:MAG: metal-sulfur cluster assembly factor [Methanopyraceae archaeon]